MAFKFQRYDMVYLPDSKGGYDTLLKAEVIACRSHCCRRERVAVVIGGEVLVFEERQLTRVPL